MAMDQQLLMAARTGNLMLIRQLVDAESNILEAKTPQGNTALHMAARFGHTDLVEEMVNWQPDLASKTNLKGETPVHVASKAGQFNVVRLFKATVEDMARIRDNEGNTPVHCSVRNNHKLVLYLLVDGDQESLGLVNNAGESPLFIAIDLRLTLANDIIFANPSTLDHTGDSDQTPLHRAVIRRNLGTICHLYCFFFPCKLLKFQLCFLFWHKSHISLKNLSAKLVLHDFKVSIWTENDMT